MSTSDLISDNPSDRSCGRQAPTSVDVKLLISVKDAGEARMVLRAGADWIDLKDPIAGPLGAANHKVSIEVGRILANHPLRSAALGEIFQLDHQFAARMANQFPTLKVGLSNMSRNRSWRKQLEQVSKVVSDQGSALVPVVYADWRDCDAPSPVDIARVSSEIRCGRVLIDTYTKRGGNLFSWMSPPEVLSTVYLLQEHGCKVVLAGSVEYEMLDELLALPVEAVGIRGAVCSGARSNAICPQKLERWVARFNSP